MTETQCVICGENLPLFMRDGQLLLTAMECVECGKRPLCEDCAAYSECDEEPDEYEFPTEL